MSLGQLSEGAILCTIDVVGLYLNIPHEEGLASLRRFLDAGTEKKVPTEALLENFKAALGTAIVTKFAARYANLFMANLESLYE